MLEEKGKMTANKNKSHSSWQASIDSIDNGV